MSFDKSGKDIFNRYKIILEQGSFGQLPPRGGAAGAMDKISSAMVTPLDAIWNAIGRPGDPSKQLKNSNSVSDPSSKQQPYDDGSSSTGLKNATNDNQPIDNSIREQLKQEYSKKIEDYMQSVRDRYPLADSSGSAERYFKDFDKQISEAPVSNSELEYFKKNLDRDLNYRFAEQEKFLESENFQNNYNAYANSHRNPTGARSQQGYGGSPSGGNHMIMPFKATKSY